MPARPVVTTRRTALAVAAGVTGLAVGGCTSDSPDDPADPATTSAPPVDADQTLVDEVVERLATALAHVVQAAAGRRAAGRSCAAAPVDAPAHLEALDADASTPMRHPTARR